MGPTGFEPATLWLKARCFRVRQFPYRISLPELRTLHFYASAQTGTRTRVRASTGLYARPLHYLGIQACRASGQDPCIPNLLYLTSCILCPICLLDHSILWKGRPTLSMKFFWCKIFFMQGSRREALTFFVCIITLTLLSQS